MTPPDPTNSVQPSRSTSSLEEALERINRLASQSLQTHPTAGFSNPVRNKLPNAPTSSFPEHSSTTPRASQAPSAPRQLPPKSTPLPPPSGPKSKPISPNLKVTRNHQEPIIPLEPTTLEESGLNQQLIEELVMRFLLNRGEAAGRDIADQLKLPFRLVEPTLTKLKSQQLSCYLGATPFNDYIHSLTDAGRDRAKRHVQKTTYFGAAPVPLDSYIQSVRLQSVEHQHPTQEDLNKAFSDLLIAPDLLNRLGPAVNSGRGMFLFGYPGNGKTSIAERVTRAFGEFIWIPRCVIVDGEILRIFDPLNHEEVPPAIESGPVQEIHIDHRWVRIRRPTIVAGGELTMAMLEVARNPETNISDAPLQMKSNCGVLLIDDFGRQRMSVDELLNRWIVPLEKRYDYISLGSGKKVQIPFDQLVIFSTNLEPKDLVDDAFLRRIPYKIEVTNPSEAAFRKLFEIMCRSLKIPYRADIIDYLIETHYKPVNRPMRNCHPRDLLLQVRAYCYFRSVTPELKKEYIDFAVENYFSIM